MIGLLFGEFIYLYTDTLSCSCGLDSMTLTHELDMEILEIYLYTKS